MSGYYLTNADLAGYYVGGANAVAPGDGPVELKPKIESWLDKSGLSHRRADAFLIGIEAAKLTAKPSPDPSDAARLADVREGYGDRVPDLTGMSQAEYAKFRQQPGMPGAVAQGRGLFGQVR